MDSHEMQLLLRCARVRLEERDRAEIARCLKSGLGWEWLLRMAREHRVDGFLAHHLSALDVSQVDRTALAELGRLRRVNTIKNLRLTKVLFELLDVMRERGIEMLPYKGPLLMQRVYGEIGLRRTRDLDLVIDPRDLSGCLEILSEMGFNPVIADSWIAAKARRKLDKEVTWCRGKDRVVVELHWRFTYPHYPFDLDLAALRDVLLPQDFAGRRTPSIPLEEMIVILAVHGTMHVWTGIEQLVFFAECCRQTEVDWERVVELAERFHQGRVLRLALHLAIEHLQVEPPDWLVERVKSDARCLTPLSTEVLRNWERGQHEVHQFDIMSFQMALIESRRHKLRFFLGRVFLALLKPLIAADKGQRGSIWLRPFVLTGRYLRRVMELGRKLIRPS